MLLQNLRAKMSARLSGDREAGFTLIELLVVMLILGILAAIAIPAFFNQRDKGTDAQAKAAARTAQTAIETYATDNSGNYAGAEAEEGGKLVELIAIEPTLEDVAELIVGKEVTAAGVPDEVAPDATNYAVAVKSDTDTIFTISRSGGTVTFDCSAKESGAGGCPKGGDWSQ